MDKPSEPMGRPDADITYISGTREIERAVIKLALPDGGERRIISTPLRTVYLKAGSGYMPHDGWGHGYYQGPLKVEGLSFDMSSQAKRSEWAGLNETLSRFELDTGEIGYGLHENLVIGTYRPHGFDAPGTMAP